MSTFLDNKVRIVQGDLLRSPMHGLVNPVNTAGVMGKGIAAAFKRQYPAMHADYVRRCRSGLVKIGEPYPYPVDGHVVINFPTKGHWRSVSKIGDIAAGLEYLVRNWRRWGLTGIAVPPLGCGNGQLDWSLVSQVIVDRVRQIDIPVELYAPFGAEESEPEQMSLWEQPPGRPLSQVTPWQVAVVEVLDRLNSQPHTWPVPPATLPTITYFATVAGVATGLDFERSGSRPHDPRINPAITRLRNNGVIREVQNDNRREVRAGETFNTARAKCAKHLEKWDQAIESTVDLMARFDAGQAETAAMVHYCAVELERECGAAPKARDVLRAAEAWGLKTKLPLHQEGIPGALVSLATRHWIRVRADESIREYLEEISSV
ncbi:macro domain-containing protein [Streptomyces chrestomyceticus]|uniref:macro domain-containing protein n=1 Tax=Streptomyces chrestomyceticus TaxID=68185 RepID=UPI0033EE44C0